MQKYQIIYADPPWAYPESRGGDNSRGMAIDHYPTMETKDICALPIQQLKTDDAVCFMWATFPKINQALEVMEAWGFQYKNAAFVWVKRNKISKTYFWGMGAYTRANAEICLLGISKKTRARQMVLSRKVHQIVDEPFEQHSKKPDIVRDKIIELVGDLKRLELFARSKAPGWDIWGNELPNDLELIA